MTDDAQVQEIADYVRQHLRGDRSTIITGILKQWPFITGGTLQAALDLATRPEPSRLAKALEPLRRSLAGRG